MQRIIEKAIFKIINPSNRKKSENHSKILIGEIEQNCFFYLRLDNFKGNIKRYRVLYLIFSAFFIFDKTKSS